MSSFKKTITLSYKKLYSNDFNKNENEINLFTLDDNNFENNCELMLHKTMKPNISSFFNNILIPLPYQKLFNKKPNYFISFNNKKFINKISITQNSLKKIFDYNNKWNSFLLFFEIFIIKFYNNEILYSENSFNNKVALYDKIFINKIFSFNFKSEYINCDYNSLNKIFNLSNNIENYFNYIIVNIIEHSYNYYNNKSKQNIKKNIICNNIDNFSTKMEKHNLLNIEKNLLNIIFILNNNINFLNEKYFIIKVNNRFLMAYSIYKKIINNKNNNFYIYNYYSKKKEKFNLNSINLNNKIIFILKLY